MPIAPQKPRKAPPSQKPPDRKAVVEDARKSVEDAASVSGTLWLSYLFTLFYIGLAAGGVTHKDLLLENPVKLPFLGVDLPLVWFFALSPILFVIVHAYALTHFVMLAGKIGAFKETIKGLDGEADQIRRRLPSNIFAQFLAGPADIQHGGLGVLLRLIAWTTLVVAPVLLLLFLQAQFLPYHLEWITWVQRIAVLADVVILWALWPAVLAGESEIAVAPPQRVKRFARQLSLIFGPLLLLFVFQALLRNHFFDAIRWLVLIDFIVIFVLWPTFAGVARAMLWRSLRPHTFLIAFGGLSVAFAFFVATFPGGFLGEFNRDTRWIPANKLTAMLGAVDGAGKPVATSVYHLIFAGEVDEISRRPRSPFYTSLLLIGFDALEVSKIDSEDKLKLAKSTLLARGRNMRGARFDFADLRKSDMSGADLREASFFKSKMQESILERADLRNSNLALAQFDGASFDKAHLEGTLIHRTQLFGASFVGANLEGAYFRSTRLDGAWLVYTHLEGARFLNSELKSTVFLKPHLEGANVINSHLDGALIDEAELQGVLLKNSTIDGAIVRNSCVLSSSFVDTDVTKNTILRGNKSNTETCGLSQVLYDDIVARIKDNIMDEHASDYALFLINTLDPKQNNKHNESEIENTTSASQRDYEIIASQNLKRSACAKDGAPYVARRLVVRLSGVKAKYLFKGFVSQSEEFPDYDPPLLPFGTESSEQKKLAQDLLDISCYGTSYLTDDEKTTLRLISENIMPDR